MKDRTVPKNYVNAIVVSVCSSDLCKAFHIVHVPNLRALSTCSPDSGLCTQSVVPTSVLRNA